MKCLLLITFVAVSAIRNSVFHSAEHFVSSMSTIDPAKINPLIDMVREMLQENNDFISGLEGEVKSCQSTVDESQKALDLADANQKKAAQELNDGVDEASRLGKIADDAKKTEAAATEAARLADEDKGRKKANLDSETSRVTAEDDLLKEVREMIVGINGKDKSLNEMSRNLLSFDIKSLLNADPTSIEELLKLIDGLIQAGADDLQTAQNEFDDASKAAVEAQGKLDDATKAKREAVGAFVKQGDQNTLLTKAANEATAAKQTAQSKLDDDTAKLNQKQDNLQTQKDNVLKEEAEMKQIISLLESVRD